jgi:hypothetical protein
MGMSKIRREDSQRESRTVNGDLLVTGKLICPEFEILRVAVEKLKLGVGLWSPVAGEPSWGSLHPHIGLGAIISGVTWTVGTTYTIDCSPHVLVGAKAVLLKVYGTSVGLSYCNFYSDSAATILHDMFLNYGIHYNSDAITCGLDSALKCYGKVVTTDMTIYVRLVGYYI